MYIHVCIYIYIYILTHAYIHKSLRVHAYIHGCTYLLACIYTNRCVCEFANLDVAGLSPASCDLRTPEVICVAPGANCDLENIFIIVHVKKR